MQTLSAQQVHGLAIVRDFEHRSDRELLDAMFPPVTQLNYDDTSPPVSRRLRPSGGPPSFYVAQLLRESRRIS